MSVCLAHASLSKTVCRSEKRGEPLSTIPIEHLVPRRLVRLMKKVAAKERPRQTLRSLCSVAYMYFCTSAGGAAVSRVHALLFSSTISTISVELAICQPTSRAIPQTFDIFLSATDLSHAPRARPSRRFRPLAAHLFYFLSYKSTFLTSTSFAPLIFSSTICAHIYPRSYM